MGKLVLLIDDDADDRSLIGEALAETDANIQIRMAANGQEALELISRDQALIPDFIIMDQNMPRMDGKQCLQELKQVARLQHVPVIILTTSKLYDGGAEFRKLGAACCFTKPCLYMELKSLMMHVLSGNWKSVEA